MEPQETQAKPLRAALYARQSVGKNDDSLSVSEQLEQCRKLAALNGFEVIAEYSDKNRASWTYPDTTEGRKECNQDKVIPIELKNSTKTEKEYYRIGLGELFKNLNKIDVIVCYNSDRLFKSLEGSGLSNYIKFTLSENNVFLFTQNEGKIDYRNEMDSFISSLTNLIKSKDLLEKKRLSILGKIKKKNNGYANVSLLSGYKIEKDKAIPLDTLPQLKTAFYSFIEGKSKVSLVRFLRNNGFPKMSLPSFDKILTCPLYAGYYLINGELQKAIQFNGVEIMTLEKWKQLQIYLNKYSKKTPTTKREYLHTGLCHCGYCGGKMNVKIKKKKIQYLLCSNYDKYKAGTLLCRSNKVKLEDNKNGEKQLNTVLKQMALVGYEQSKQMNEYNKEVETKINSKQYDLNKITDLIKEKEQEIIDNALDSDKVKSCNNILNGLNEKIKIIRNEIEELQKDIKTKIEENIYDTYAKINELPYREINKLLKSTIKKIKIFKEKIEIIWYDDSVMIIKRITTLITATYTRTVFEKDIFDKAKNGNLFTGGSKIFMLNRA